MSIFDRFKKQPTSPKADMAALARQKSPELRRLGGLKAYQALPPVARKLVRAIVIDGASPDFAASCLPNGQRALESQAVQRCLASAGWVDSRLEARVAEIKANLAAHDSARAEVSPTSHEEPINEPREESKESGTKPEDISLIPQEPISAPTMASATEPRCTQYGCNRFATLDKTADRYLCSLHSALRATEPKPAATPPPTAEQAAPTAPTAFPERDKRCSQCGLILCTCPEPVVLCDGNNRTLNDNHGQFGYLPGVGRVRYATLQENAEAWAETDANAEQRDRELRAEYERHLQRERNANDYRKVWNR